MSCHQEIASDGAFSLGMIADFAETIRATAPGGIAGCSGKRGFSARCCIWKPRPRGCARPASAVTSRRVSRLLGLTGDEFQDLYHFTVGARSRTAPDDPAALWASEVNWSGSRFAWPSSTS